MGPRRETTIEHMYREVNGHKMPPSIKRILLRKRKRTWKARPKNYAEGKDEEIRRAIVDELRRIRSLVE